MAAGRLVYIPPGGIGNVFRAHRTGCKPIDPTAFVKKSLLISTLKIYSIYRVKMLEKRNRLSIIVFDSKTY